MSLRNLVRRELSLDSRRPRRGFGFALLAAGATLLPSLPASAISWRQELLPDFASFDVGHNGNVDLADVDGDGDLDLLTNTPAGHLALFRNVGGPDEPSFAHVTGSADPFRFIPLGGTPELADLDGDGDLDLAVGDNSGQFRYYANTGSSEAPFFIQRTGSANPFTGIDVGNWGVVALSDLDADGDLDAVIGENNSKLFYFRNTGSSTAPAFVGITGTASPLFFVQPNYLYNLDPVLVDMDGDGDLDLIFGENYGKLRFSRNTGSSTAPAFQHWFDGPLATIDLDQNTSASFGDLDGDADLDLVVTDYRGAFYLHRNTGGTAAPAYAEVTGSASPFGHYLFGGLAAPEMADVDGDGDLDAFFGMPEGYLALAVNTGSSTAPAFGEFLINPFNIEVGTNADSALADLDADGDLDLLMGSSDGTFRLFSNTGSSSAASFLEVPESANPLRGIDVGDHSRPQLVDLDGDGDFDMVTGRGGVGGLRYLKNTGNATTPDFLLLTGSASPFGDVAAGTLVPHLADLDGDGDRDLILSPFVYYENTGSRTAPAFAERTGGANPLLKLVGNAYLVDAADLDGDGDLDLLCADWDGRMTFQRANGAELFADGFESGNLAAWSAVSGGS